MHILTCHKITYMITIPFILWISLSIFGCGQLASKVLTHENKTTNQLIFKDLDHLFNQLEININRIAHTPRAEVDAPFHWNFKMDRHVKALIKEPNKSTN